MVSVLPWLAIFMASEVNGCATIQRQVEVSVELLVIFSRIAHLYEITPVPAMALVMYDARPIAS